MNEYCGKRYPDGVCVMPRCHDGPCETNTGKPLVNVEIDTTTREEEPDLQ